MVGIVLATHGSFSNGILEGLEYVMGAQTDIAALSLTPEHDMDDFEASVARAVEELDSGDGVLVLLDILGGSPSIAAARTLKSDRVECVAGLNLPMLCHAVEARKTETSLKTLAEDCAAFGQEGIINLRKRLLQRQHEKEVE